jgi:hypothetical protein
MWYGKSIYRSGTGNCYAFYPKGWKPESSLSASGIGPRTSCTHERTCIGATNNLTKLAKQTTTIFHCSNLQAVEFMLPLYVYLNRVGNLYGFLVSIIPYPAGLLFIVWGYIHTRYVYIHIICFLSGTTNQPGIYVHHLKLPAFNQAAAADMIGAPCRMQLASQWCMDDSDQRSCLTLFTSWQLLTDCWVVKSPVSVLSWGRQRFTLTCYTPALQHARRCFGYSF